MGVQGLWQILEPVGQTVTLESLEGKRLAVASYGAQAYGTDVRSPHLVLLINRIAKLLFYKVRPVFVFDGDRIPVFKRHVLRDRQLRRYVDEITVNKQQKRALKEAAITGQSLGPIQLGVADDIFALPESSLNQPLPKKKLEQDDFLAGYHELVSRDDRIAFLADVKQQIKKNRLNDDDIPDNPEDFVHFQQQRVLQRVKINSEIEALRNEKVHSTANLKDKKLKSFVVDAHSRGHLLIQEAKDGTEGKVEPKPRIENWNEFVKQARKQFYAKQSKEAAEEIPSTSGSSVPNDDGVDQKEESTNDDDDFEETMKIISSEKRVVENQQIWHSHSSKSGTVDHFAERFKESTSASRFEENDSDNSSDFETVPLDDFASEDSSPTTSGEVVTIDDSEDVNELNFVRPDDSEDLVEASMEVERGIYSECQQLLTLLGLPYIVAPGEAEAQCAQLESLGLVEGVVTDDSDVWLFGGRNVYKNLFNRKKNVQFFDGNVIDKKLGLSRRDFIILTMLAGGDYTRGFDNVGIVTALEIVAEFSSKGETNDEKAFEVLKTIRKWLDSKYEFEASSSEQEHFIESSTRIRLRKAIEKSNDCEKIQNFPNREVFDAYVKPVVNSNNKQFKWQQINFTELELFLWNTIGWNCKEFHSKTHDAFKIWNSFISQQVQSYQTRITNFARQLPPSVDEQQLAPTKRVETALKKLLKSKGMHKSPGKHQKPVPTCKPVYYDSFSDEEDISEPPKKVARPVRSTRTTVKPSELQLSEESDAD